MKINIRADSVTVEGYVNAVERASKPLYSRFGRFVEKICAGAFGRALKRNNNVRILLNHDWSRDLGGTATGELELEEDNIGLHARATITDPEVVKDARAGNLVGWSFGFNDMPDGVEETRDAETGLPFRKVKDLELFEVSLLNRKKTPAYVGTLVNVRDDKEILISDDYTPENIELIDETIAEALEEIRENDENIKSFDNSRYINIVAELKEIRDSVNIINKEVKNNV